MIDVFTHISPPKFTALLEKKSQRPSYYAQANASTPALLDLDARLRVLERFPGRREILSLATPPVEHVTTPADAAELAKVANEEMAEMVEKHPKFFAGAIACLPMNDVDAALKEADRAIRDLHFRGVQISSSVNGKPLDRPEFMGLYEKMAGYDLPIWIHPVRDSDIPDYPDEKESLYALCSTFGWPFETTLAMSRLVYSGVLEKYPDLKISTHHCGGMVPYFAQRVALKKSDPTVKIPRPPIDYFRRFYGDTALGGNAPALMCGCAFFGADRVLFATDYPYSGPAGEQKVVLTIEAINAMDISAGDKEKIFFRNAQRLLKLS